MDGTESLSTAIIHFTVERYADQCTGLKDSIDNKAARQSELTG